MNLYRMLDVTRIYAEIKLADSGQQPQVMRRLARFCADYLQNANASPAIDGARSRPGELAIGNVRAALDWCFAAEGDIKLGIDLAAGASRMFLDRSMLGECLRWCRTALAYIGESEPFSIRTLRLQESLALCLMYTSGNDDRVGGVIERGLEMAAALGARQSELHLLAGQNLYLTRREDFQGALDAAERFAARVGGSTDPVEIVAAEWMLGSTHHLIGRERMGHEILERGFARAETFGIGKVHYFGFDHAGRAAISRAWIAWLCGAPEQAIGHAKQALNASVAQNHPVSLCITYLYTTWVVLWLRDLDWAEDLTEALIELATKHQLKPYLTGGQALKGELLLARDQVKAGITLLQDAIEPLRTEQQTIVLTPTLRAYAEGLARLGQNEEAEKTISDVVNRAETTSPTYMLPELIRTQADVMLARSPGDFDRAQACYRKAITRAQVHGALGWELRAAISLARLLIETGRLEQARDLLQRTISLFTEGFATRDLLDAQQLLQRC